MKKNLIITCLMMAMASGVHAQEAQVRVKTPLMGWSSWNTYGININENLIKRQAKAMKEKGLQQAGYQYVNIDDGYFGGRDAQGHLLIHPVRFPNGIKVVADYIHSLGLKAGIYSDAGRSTCANYFGGDTISHDVGLYGHDQEDCDNFFKDWGFDFIKVDFCGGSPYHNANHVTLSEKERYTAIAQAIKNTGCDVAFNACRWDYPGNWIHDVADSWRISHDIAADWSNVADIIKQGLYLSAYCRDGHYNDMDMLEVGRGFTKAEDQTHFALWCIMDSPLLIGCDMVSMGDETRKLLCNKELIALNQDSLHLQAQPVQWIDSCYVLVKDFEQLHGNKRAVAIYNSSSKSRSIYLKFKDVCLGGSVKIRELINGSNLNAKTDSMRVVLQPHGTRVYMLTGEQRLEQTRYEAENAYISDYQELVNNQAAKTGIYATDDVCSGKAKCGWLGYSANNDLVWRDVYSEQGGSYDMTIAFMTGDNRSIAIDVNGKRVTTKTVNSGAYTRVGKVTVKVQLEAGFNTVRLHNDTNWMPDIDYIDLKADATTGLENVEAKKGQKGKKTYNMAGQRVNGKMRGLQIKNGKKVVI